MRRRVLAAVERAGGWPTILARIASGEEVAEIARSFRVSRGFLSRLLHEDRDRHALALEARWRAEGDALLAEAVELIGFGRPGAERLRMFLGKRTADLDRATLAVLDRTRSGLSGAALLHLPEEGDAPPNFGALFMQSLQKA